LRGRGSERSRRHRLAAFYLGLRGEVLSEAARDPEPELRFTEDWTAWLERDVARRGQLVEISESEALTICPEDPAPVASQGFGVFHEWVIRQEGRCRARSTA
jgi:hypothetical protein